MGNPNCCFMIIAGTFFFLQAITEGNCGSWLPFAIKTQIGAGQKCLAWQQERTQAQKCTGTYIRILEAESYHYYLNSPLKKIALITQKLDMTYHSLIILAFILLNLFYNINGRSIQCPSEWIPNGDEGKTLLKMNTSRTAEAEESRGTHAPRFQHIRSTRFSVLAPSHPCT